MKSGSSLIKKTLYWSFLTWLQETGCCLGYIRKIRRPFKTEDMERWMKIRTVCSMIEHYAFFSLAYVATHFGNKCHPRHPHAICGLQIHFEAFGNVYLKWYIFRSFKSLKLWVCYFNCDDLDSNASLIIHWWIYTLKLERHEYNTANTIRISHCFEVTRIAQQIKSIYMEESYSWWFKHQTCLLKLISVIQFSEVVFFVCLTPWMMFVYS